MKILIIDECECLRTFCAIVLSDAGHEVIQSGESDYKTVIESFHREINVVILNINPLSPEIANKVHETILIHNPDIKIIFISIPWTGNIIKDILKDGHYFLPIPFQADDLVGVCNKIFSASPVSVL